MGAKRSHSLGVNCHVVTVQCIYVDIKCYCYGFESQLILNDFDSAAIAGVDQLCEPSVLRLGERERGRGREGEGERGSEGERGGKRGKEREKVIHYQL